MRLLPPDGSAHWFSPKDQAPLTVQKPALPWSMKVRQTKDG
jgi:hypothetical protein